MADSTEVLIGDANEQHVLIRPLGRCHPGFFDYYDGNWIDCDVQMAVGGFRSHFRANFRSEEFRTFLEGVRRLMHALEGTASFTTMEGQLALYLSGDGKGLVRVSGEAGDEAGSSNRLQFAFDIDQTYLELVARSLENLLAAFPVLDAADA